MACLRHVHIRLYASKLIRSRLPHACALMRQLTQLSYRVLCLCLSLSWPAAGRVNNSTSKIFIPGCTVHRISNVRLATDMNEGDKMEVLHQQEESSLENGGESTDLYCMAMHAAPSPCNRYFCSLAIMALSCREGSVVAKIKLLYSLHRVSACWCSMRRGRDRSMWLTASRV